jgi:hypothetical protein
MADKLTNVDIDYNYNQTKKRRDENLTTAQRTALSLSASHKGYTVFDTDINAVCVWTGSSWTIDYKIDASPVGTGQSLFYSYGISGNTQNIYLKSIKSNDANISVSSNSTEILISLNAAWANRYASNTNGAYITSSDGATTGAPNTSQVQALNSAFNVLYNYNDNGTTRQHSIFLNGNYGGFSLINSYGNAVGFTIDRANNQTTFSGNVILSASNPIAGYIWTCTGADGRGAWMAPSGGGGVVSSVTIPAVSGAVPVATFASGALTLRSVKGIGGIYATINGNSIDIGLNDATGSYSSGANSYLAATFTQSAKCAVGVVNNIINAVRFTVQTAAECSLVLYNDSGSQLQISDFEVIGSNRTHYEVANPLIVEPNAYVVIRVIYDALNTNEAFVTWSNPVQ